MLSFKMLIQSDYPNCKRFTFLYNYVSGFHSKELLIINS